MDTDSFLFFYAVAVLAFFYKSNHYLKLLDTDYLRVHVLRNPAISVIQKAITANSEAELKEILESCCCMNVMVKWLKELATPGTIYDFSEENLLQIENLFKKVGICVNVAKEKEDYSFLAGSSNGRAYLKDIYIDVGAHAEFVLNKNGIIIYFSDS